MEMLDQKSTDIVSLFSRLDNSLDVIRNAFQKRALSLKGEKYLSNKDLSRILQMSERTLQGWRDNGIISYIQISGKILYRQSDILKLLEDSYCKSWRED